MKILVLGGHGFVGSALVRTARRNGHEVAAVTRENYARHRGRSCDLLINANGNSRKYLAEQNPPREFDASVVSVQRSLLDFPCRRYLYLSTIDVYPRTDLPRFTAEDTEIRPEQISRYGLHKWLAEQIVRRYAPRWLILRLGGMVGEGLWKNSIFDLLHRKPLRVHLRSRYQYLATDDVARIALTLARRQPANDVFNVCGNGCVSLAQVAAWISGCRPRYASRKPAEERYAVNIAKLKAWMPVPGSSDTVRQFLGQPTRS